MCITTNRRLDKAERKTYISAYKLKQGCSECGYNDNSDALHLDHLPQYDKISGLSQMVSDRVSWDKIEAELAKCQVLCANCHSIKTQERRSLDKATIGDAEGSPRFQELMTKLYKI
jgi:5-methylcytosine-specific restriction endonuclease McrA